MCPWGHKEWNTTEQLDWTELNTASLVLKVWDLPTIPTVRGIFKDAALRVMCY